MKNLKTGTLMLSLGLIVGSGATVVVHASQPAVAAEGMAMEKTSTSSMNMTGKSVGDREMNAAMERMSDAMKTTKFDGVVDRDFMLMMIPHHRSAVDMAKIELARGTHPELKALARDVIRSQDREIGKMHAWLKAWYGGR